LVSHITERIQNVGVRDIWTYVGGSKRRLENILNEKLRDFLRLIKRYYDFQITEYDTHGARTGKRKNANILTGSSEEKRPL
jgi:hypothetical protein